MLSPAQIRDLLDTASRIRVARELIVEVRLAYGQDLPKVPRAPKRWKPNRAYLDRKNARRRVGAREQQSEGV